MKTVLLAVTFSALASLACFTRVVTLGTERETYRAAYESARAELESLHRTKSMRSIDVAYKCVRK